MRIVGICSLYEPLEFLANRIRNLNQCDLKNVSIYFADCSSDNTWKEVQKVVESSCKFNYKLHHFNNRTTLYYTWNWVIDQTLIETEYYCNTNVDDIQEPSYFQKMAGFLDTYPNYKIVACPWLITSKKGQIWPPESENNSGPIPEKTMGHFPMWRASLHREGVRFDPRMVCVGDSYFWTKVRQKYGVGVLAVHNETLSCYLSHNNNLYYSSRGPHGESGEAWDRSIGR